MATAKYTIGQLVSHRLFDYRGVIYDIDPEFMLTDEWYDRMARTQPPKDKPWYHVLVDGAAHTTYVAEQNLTASSDGEKISHPLLSQYFSEFQNGAYRSRRLHN